MARKILAATFAALFVLAIAAPALKTNLRRNQRSHLDNRMLNEFPRPKDIRNGFRPKLERALRDRVGFREQMLASYFEINKTLFGTLEHRSYLEGKDGHLYYNNESYINGYRNVYDEEAVEVMAQYVAQIESYAQERGADFFFFLPPDKKTVYPEYFPEHIHKTDATPFIEALSSRLDELAVDYVSPLDAFLAIKGDIKLYNRQFDIVHWNADGAIIGISLLLDRIHVKHPEVPPLDRGNYERMITKGEVLLRSGYKIDEDVPLYTAKDNRAAIDEALSAEVAAASGDDCAVYNNAALDDGLTALVFHDSYLGTDALGSDQYRSFLAMSFKRAVFVHHRHLDKISWYFNAFSPDIVILEAVERMIGPGWTRMIDSTFFPRASSTELAPDESVAVSLEELDIARRSHLTSISGKLAIGGAVISVYLKVGEKELPAQVDEEGRFSLTLSNTALEGRPDIALTPANEEFSYQPLACSF